MNKIEEMLDELVVLMDELDSKTGYYLKPTRDDFNRMDKKWIKEWIDWWEHWYISDFSYSPIKIMKVVEQEKYKNIQKIFGL